MSVTEGPLAGVQVLDLSRLLPGGACTRLLADLGARVIKVEQPGGGDAIRGLPPLLGDGTSVAHQVLDAGKRSVALDLKDPRDVQVAITLAVHSDAVLETFRPGVADRLGLGYGALASHNPALTYVSLSGYGQSGPRAGEAGHDINYTALAGILGTSGSADHGPTLTAALIADMMGGTLAALAVSAGVAAARRSGRGEHVDLSLHEAALWAVSVPLLQHLADGTEWRGGRGMLNGGWPCYNVYRCADGRHVAVGALERQFWTRLVEALDRPDLEGRAEDHAAVAELQQLFATLDRDAWLERLADLDACVTAVNDLGAAAREAHVLHRGCLQDVPTPDGVVRQLRSPVRFAANAAKHSPAPALGADTAWARALHDSC